MKVLELFAGTRSIGKAFENNGHEVFSVECDRDFDNIDLYEDIGKITAKDIIEKFGYPDVIWASPDCSSYSIAAISHHRKKNVETGSLDPVSDYAKFCDSVNLHVLDLIKELQPKFYFMAFHISQRYVHIILLVSLLFLYCLAILVCQFLTLSELVYGTYLHFYKLV